MSGEFTPKATHAEAAAEVKQPTLEALQLAGALQAVVSHVSRRDYSLDLDQEDGLNAIGHGLLDGETAGYLESATGSGKSLYIALLAEAATNAGLRTHILASSKRNADQLSGVVEGKGLARFGTLVERGLVKQNYGGRRANPKHRVVVSTYAGYLEDYKARQRGGGRLGEFDLILGDECHASLGDETSRALYRDAPNAVKVGFSATPDYAEDRKSQEIWGRRWHEFSMRQSIEAGKAAPMRAMVMATDTELTLQDYRREFTEKELAPLINNFERNGLAAQLAQDFVKDGRQGIIACVPGDGNAHATAMADLLSQQELEPGGRKMVVKDVGSHLSDDVNNQRIRDFEAGKIDILTSTKALEASWDSKKPSFCINLSPTTSPVRIKQLMGRIGRPNEDGRESIFVDFVDENMGSIHKMQYTGVHALDYEDIDVERVLGWGYQGVNTPQVKQRRSIASYIRPELLDRLMRVQGKSLTNVLAGRGKPGTRVDPLFAHWDRILAKEGMPAEPAYNIAFTHALDSQYQKAAKILQVVEGEAPTPGEVIESLDGLTQQQQRVLSVYGERVLDATGELVYTTEQESVEDIVARLMLKYAVAVCMETLSERETGVIRLRFLSDKEYSLSEIGEVYGVQGTRIQQILNKTLSKLRHPDRANYLNDYYGANYPLPGERRGAKGSTPPYRPAKSETVFSGYTGIPFEDENDARPYAERLRLTAQFNSDSWYRGKQADLVDIMGEGAYSQEKLAGVAKKIEPVGYWVGRTYYPAGELPEGTDAEKASKSYNLNALRLAALNREYFAAKEELHAHQTARSRIENAIDATPASITNSLTVLEPRIDVLQKWIVDLRRHIHTATEHLDDGQHMVL